MKEPEERALSRTWRHRGAVERHLEVNFYRYRVERKDREWIWWSKWKLTIYFILILIEHYVVRMLILQMRKLKPGDLLIIT